MKQELLRKLNNINSVNKDILLSLIEECLLLELKENMNNYSCIGKVELPLTFECEKVKNLKLIAKINIEDLYFSPKNFPKKGMFLIFININDLGYRFPFYKNEYKIIFIEDNVLINDFNKINKSNLIFKNSISFPSYQETIIVSNFFELTDLKVKNGIEDYIELISHNFDIGINHQIFGHPEAAQGAVKFWWALSYLGFTFSDIDRLTEDQILLIKEEEKKFILLLQINFGDAKINIGSNIFGDSIAYFGIHIDDLKIMNFEKVVLIMQSP